MSLLQNSNAIESGSYAISNSLRFQSASSQYASRTFATSGTSNTIKTISFWVKRGVLSSASTPYQLFGAYDGSSGNDFGIWYDTGTGFSTDSLRVSFGGAAAYDMVTSAVYRDPSSWYHVVIAFDTTQATSSNRVKFYVNGSQITSFNLAQYPTQNSTVQFGLNNANNRIGCNWNASSRYFDGYMTEINFVDGQQLTPSSFGQTDTLTGQWVAKKYTGTYGTNGFYLPFSNGTSTTTLGADSSGNSNNWTLNNFTRSAGVSDCWMKDVPSGNGGVSGTQPNANYCVFNPLVNAAVSTYSRGNLQVTSSNTIAQIGTIGVSSGKWYWESFFTGSVGGQPFVAGLTQGNSVAGYPGSSTAGGVGYYYDGQKYVNGTASSYGASYTVNDVIGTALDLDAGTITFYKNGVSQGTASSGLTGTWFPTFSSYTGTLNVNFGQRSFAYTPPTGFKALCTANLPAATIKKGNQYMDATLWTGDNTTPRSITNAAGFSPDIVWMKSRSLGIGHNVYDTVRGAGGAFGLITNSTEAEGGTSGSTSMAQYGYLSAFNSNGFQVTSGSVNNNYVNNNTNTYVAWQWDAGSSTVTNTNGTISSQVRANPTAGVSVVTYTGNGVSSATVGHGLGVAPKMVIHKCRSATGAWKVNHVGIPNQWIDLNLTDAASSGGGTNGSLGYQSTNTSTTFQFTAGSSTVNNVNANGSTYVAYCFSEIAGFSKFGSYTGNGSADGVFTYTGFTPKFIMIKRTDTADSWVIYDISRSQYNESKLTLYPNLSNAESADANGIDILSNGFKMRNTYSSLNVNGGTYIYMAFATNPFQNSNAR